MSSSWLLLVVRTVLVTASSIETVGRSCANPKTHLGESCESQLCSSRVSEASLETLDPVVSYGGGL